MTFSPIINHSAEQRGIRMWYVSERDGVWLGTVRITPDAAGFATSAGEFASKEQMIRIAHFIAEKTDAK